MTKDIKCNSFGKFHSVNAVLLAISNENFCVSHARSPFINLILAFLLERLISVLIHLKPMLNLKKWYEID